MMQYRRTFAGDSLRGAGFVAGRLQAESPVTPGPFPRSPLLPPPPSALRFSRAWMDRWICPRAWICRSTLS